jgi:hydroxymethylpyrimidine kinase/phosphomethylpyrimidine kinase/thiamine-phosphate diphosphorylase
LAKMATTQALRHAYAAGAGAGPVLAQTGFACDPSLLPALSWGEALPRLDGASFSKPPSLGLYAVVDNLEWLEQVLAAGIRTVQLRIKTPPEPSAAWWADLRLSIAKAVALSRAQGAELFINDHWRLALAEGAEAVHLGQEDLLAMSDPERQALCASGMKLGISTHSVWELCRARTLSPRYIACGPVWPTLTKAMPWLPQGLHNLSWWHQMAGFPVVAIGGILSADQVEAAARCGADGVAVVRALQQDPAAVVPLLQAAWHKGQAEKNQVSLALPKPSLASLA